jgi:hypothetical protein
MTEVRVTTVGTDVLYEPEPSLRVTAVGVDVLYKPDPSLRVTTVGIDVLWKEGEAAVRQFRVAVIG